MRNEHPKALYFTDIIEYSITPHKISLAFIAKLYIEDGLLASQISSRIGLSKTSVLERLRSLDIKKGSKTKDKYSTPNAPYGYKKIGDQIVPCKKGMKICRMIVTNINKNQLSYRAIARLLESKKIKNRNQVSWSHTVASSIFERWNGKL